MCFCIVQGTAAAFWAAQLLLSPRTSLRAGPPSAFGLPSTPSTRKAAQKLIAREPGAATMRALVLLGSLGAARAYTGYAVGPEAVSYQAAVCRIASASVARLHRSTATPTTRPLATHVARRRAGLDSGRAGAIRARTHSSSYGAGRTIRRPARTRTTIGRQASPDYNEYDDERHAVMNDPGYYSFESSGLWFATHSDTWSTYVPLCGVNAPTTAPTLSPCADVVT